MKIKVINLLLGLFFTSSLLAQTNFSGTWNATLNVAGSLRLVLHVQQQQDDTYTASLDSPDQNATGIKCDNATATGNTFTFAIDKLKVRYTGNLINDTTLSGTFTQGASLPLDFHRTSVPFVAKPIVRPQTPMPPFPYKIEEVIYTGNGLQYGGTLTIPQGKGKFPAVLLITGSGQQDRDETIFHHKPFAVLADVLTRDGFVVLRVDDRGKGNSTGNFANSTTADFAKDVNASVDYLKSRTEVNDKKVGLMGHSEGGMIAPMVASQRTDINFIILLAGPGIKIVDLMAEQNADVEKSLGINAALADDFKPYFKTILENSNSTSDTMQLLQKTMQTLNDFASKTDSNSLKTLNIFTDKERELYAQELVKGFSSPWFKYFLQFDPEPYLTKLRKVKVLALNGSKDIQVNASQNLPAIRNDLVAGKTKQFEVKELQGLNHLFQTCNKCTVQEYGELEETFSPVALQTIIEWLNKNVK
ncbi:MAG: alpha/beta fold hydrolase [Bacteroidetes bacterium]|nr:alpha/beta fold hydrolase [Bacteroidota bacterium]